MKRFLPCCLVLITIAFSMGIRTTVERTEYENAGANRGQYVVGDEVPDFASTCAFTIREGGTVVGMGSGVLIASNLVLTAGHVVLDQGDPGQFDLGCKVQFGPDLANPTSVHRITKAALPPALDELKLRKILLGAASGSGRQESLAALHDIAIISIDPPCTNRPAIVARLAPQVGDRSWFAGYGQIALGARTKAKGQKKKKGRRGKRRVDTQVRLAAENIIDRVIYGSGTNTDNVSDPIGGALLLDFDNGDEAYNRLNLKTAKGDLKICRAGKSDAQPLPLEASCCLGDSGGPMFAKVNDTWTLVGICSYVFEAGGKRGYSAFQYGEIFSYTAVHPFADWIRSEGGLTETNAAP